MLPVLQFKSPNDYIQLINTHDQLCHLKGSMKQKKNETCKTHQKRTKILHSILLLSAINDYKE